MGQKFDVVIFDLDSTLVTIEGLTWLAKATGKKEGSLLSSALDGQIPLLDAFRQELSLLAPSYKDLLLLGNGYREALVEDAQSVVDALHYMGKDVWIISNNFYPAIDIIGTTLKVPRKQIIGIDVLFDQSGYYRGFDEKNFLVRNGGKAEIIKHLIRSDHRVVCIGDGIPDLETKPVVDLFIGYGGVVSRSKVREQAHLFIESPVLSTILPYILEKEEMEFLENPHLHAVLLLYLFEQLLHHS